MAVGHTTRVFELPGDIPEGARNDTLFRYGRSLRARDGEEESIGHELALANRKRCRPPLPENEISSIVRSVCSVPAGRSPGYDGARRAVAAATLDAELQEDEVNDKDLSRMFSEKYRDRLRYIPEDRKWCAYDGTRWARGEQGECIAQRLMKEFVDELCRRAAASGDGSRARLMQHASTYNAQGKRERLLKDCKSELATPLADFDRDPMLFNCLNCTLDLRTGEEMQHDPRHMITLVAGCKHNEGASYAQWRSLLLEIFSGDEELAGYMQMRIGEALAADTSAHCFDIAFGEPRTGKSTVLGTVLAMFGEYGTTIRPEVLQDERRTSRDASPSVARLFGKRFVECPEPPSSMVLDAAEMKRWTGGDALAARELYGGEFTFIPMFQVWLNTNYLPDVRDSTIFTSGRVHIVPFARRLKEDERDPTLAPRLREGKNLSAVLNWALDGLLMSAVSDRHLPEACRAAVADYEEETDVLGSFIADRCETGKTYYERGTELHRKYSEWAQENGFKPLGSRRFYSELARRNGITDMGAGSLEGCKERHVFQGVRLSVF